jgi:hypothetical protein
VPLAGASKHLDVSEKEILMSSRNMYDAVDGVQSQARVLADGEAADLELLERRLSVRDLATQFESGQAAAAKLLEDEVCVFPELNLSLPYCTLTLFKIMSFLIAFIVLKLLLGSYQVFLKPYFIASCSLGGKKKPSGCCAHWPPCILSWLEFLLYLF